jgi:hypothetical protein
MNVMLGCARAVGRWTEAMHAIASHCCACSGQCNQATGPLHDVWPHKHTCVAPEAHAAPLEL